MKTVSIVLFIITALVTTRQLQAQDSTRVSTDEKQAAVLSRLTHELALTPTQQQQVAGLLATRAQQLQVAKRSSMALKQTKREAADQSAQNTLATILTPVQLEKYKLLRRQLKEARQAHARKQAMPPVDVETDF